MTKFYDILSKIDAYEQAKADPNRRIAYQLDGEQRWVTYHPGLTVEGRQEGWLWIPASSRRAYWYDRPEGGIGVRIYEDEDEVDGAEPEPFTAE